MITKLAIITDALKNNPEIKTFGPLFHNEHMDNGIVETAIWTIAPIQPITDAGELNKFMTNLITDLRPTGLNRFIAPSKGEKILWLGSCWHDEACIIEFSNSMKLVAKRGSTLALSGPEFSDGARQKTEKRAMTYRIQFQVYPHTCFAKANLRNGSFDDRIPISRLNCKCRVVRPRARAAAATA